MGKSFYGKLSIDGLAIYDDNTDIDNDVLSINMMKTLFNTWTDKTYFKSDEYRTYIKNIDLNILNKEKNLEDLIVK